MRLDSVIRHPSMIMYRLNPSQTIYEPTDGPVHALTEVFLLIACEAGASQLKFATPGESLRIALVVDGTLFEYPQPPDCVRAPMMGKLRQIFSMSSEQTHAQCELHLEATTALVQLEFRNDGALVTILRNFEDRAKVASMLNRFWRDNAARQGLLVLTRYYMMEAIRFSYNAVNKAIHPGRGTAAA